MSNEVVLKERLVKVVDPITNVLIGVPGDVIPRSVYDNVKKHNARFLKPTKAEPKAEKPKSESPKKRGRPKKEYRPDEDTTIVNLD